MQNVYRSSKFYIEIDNNDKIQDLIWHNLYQINVESFNTNNLPLQSQINIYTDGSKTDFQVGLGFTIMKGTNTLIEGAKRLPDKTMVFQAELTAFKLAMHAIADKLTDQDRYVKLFSDSRAAIQVLNSSTLALQLVNDTITAINMLGEIR